MLISNLPQGHIIRGIFAVVDGGHLPCEDYEEADLQSTNYEGYTGKVEVIKLLVFNFPGEVIHTCRNPGCWNDNEVAGTSEIIYPKVADAKTLPGLALIG